MQQTVHGTWTQGRAAYQHDGTSRTALVYHASMSSTLPSVVF